jgi:hypothetical protein
VEVFLLAGRLLLAIVFAVAGATKIRDIRGFKRALGEFGIPTALAGPASMILPVIELSIALALVPSLLPVGASIWAAAAAAMLLVLFTAVIGVNLLLGRRPTCHCFGQLDAKSAGPGTLARSSVLSVLAGVVAWNAWNDPSSFSWTLSRDPASIFLLFLVLLAFGLLAVVLWVIIHLLVQQGRLLLRIEELEDAVASNLVPSDLTAAPVSGSQAPLFRLEDLNGTAHGLSELLLRRNPVILLFSNPGCGPCSTLMPDVARWQRDHAKKITLAIVSSGPLGMMRMIAHEHGLRDVFLERRMGVSRLYGIVATPIAVAINPDGTMGDKVSGAAAIRDFVHGIIDGKRQPVQATPAEVNHKPLAAPHFPSRPTGGSGQIDGVSAGIAKA